MTGASFKKRTTVLLLFLLLWAGIAAGHVFYYSVWKKDKYLAESEKIGWKEFPVPPLRGAIRDKNNAVIIQTRVRYDLVITRVSSSLEARKKRRRQLLRLYPSFLFEMPQVKNPVKINPEGLYCGMILKKDLSPDEVLYYAAQERIRRDFTVKAVFYRECTVKNLPEKTIRKLGILLPDENGILQAVCGLEKEYDRHLKGKAGKVRVMLNKYGFWVTETIQGSAPENGKDLVLSVSKEELLQGKDFTVKEKRGESK